MVKGIDCLISGPSLVICMPEWYPADAVKQVILLPVVFLFAFLCAVALFSTLCFFVSWGGSWDGAQKPTAELAVRQMPSIFRDVLVPSILTALLMVGMRSTRKPVHRLVLLPVALFLSFGIAVGGFLGLEILDRGTMAAAPAAERPLAERSFTRVGPVFLSAEKVDGAELGGVLLVSPDAPGARFRVLPAATVERAGDLLRVKAGKADGVLAEGRVEGAADGIFRMDPVVEAFLSDLGSLKDDLHGLQSSSFREFLAAVFSLLFALTASFVFLRLTRWPLANLFLYVLASRGALLLFRLLRRGLGAGIAASFTSPLIVRLFPYGVFVAVGLLLLLVDLLFVPADRLREGGF